LENRRKHRRWLKDMGTKQLPFTMGGEYNWFLLGKKKKQRRRSTLEDGWTERTSV